MECVVFTGIQGTGKSAFFKDRFADTHVRINRDMLKTRGREARFFELCLDTGQRCVIDNTNPTIADRARYIAPARARSFAIIGYWFDVPVKEALARNAARPVGQRVPVPGVYRAAKLLERPQRAEGFDALFRVQIVESRFVVEPLSE
jgi:predicted kinase